MSLLNRINRKSQPPKPESLLHQLILNMQNEKTLDAHLDRLQRDNNLSPSARQELKNNLVDFLVRDLERVQEKEDPLPLLIRELGSELDSPTMGFTPESFRQQAKPLFDTLIREFNLKLNAEEKDTLWQGIVSEYVGFGPLDALIADGSIREIVVMGYRTVYVRKQGKLETWTEEVFTDDDHYTRIIDRMFPYDEDETKLPVRSTQISRTVTAFCLYQDVAYMHPVLILHKYQ